MVLSRRRFLTMACSCAALAACRPEGAPTPAAAPKTGPAQAASPPSAGVGAGKLMIYTSIAADIANQIKSDFAAANPSITPELFQSGSEKVIAKLTAEMEAGGIQADVLAIADPSYYRMLKAKGQLQPYASPEATPLPDELKDPDGAYTAIRVINMTIVFNPGKIAKDELPSNWTDLADATWKKQFVMPSPLYSGSTYVSVAALAKKYGWDFFKALRANQATVEEGNEGVERKVASGEYKLGMLLDLNVRQAQSKGSPLGMLTPRDGHVSIPSAVTITRSARNAAAAKTFVDFMLSPAGQKSIARGFMIPVRADVEPPRGAPTREEALRRSLPMDWAYLAEQQSQVKEEFTRIMLD